MATMMSMTAHSVNAITRPNCQTGTKAGTVEQIVPAAPFIKPPHPSFGGLGVCNCSH